MDRIKHQQELKLGKNTYFSLFYWKISESGMFAWLKLKYVKALNFAYFASRASANTPAASGAAALVPEWVFVHFPYRSVVATPVLGS